MYLLNQVAFSHFPKNLNATSPSPGILVFIATVFLSTRFLFATLLFPVCIPGLITKMSPRSWKLGIINGAVFGLGMIAQVMGLGSIPASRSGFLTSLAVVFTPVIVVIFTKERIKLSILVGAILAIIGSAFLTGIVNPETFAISFEKGLTQGDLLTLVSALLFSGSIILTDVFSKKTVPIELTPGMFLGVVIVTLPGAIYQATQFGGNKWCELLLDPNFSGLTFLMSLFCTMVPFSLMTAYQHFFSPAHASLIYCVEPIFACAWAMVLPELISPIVGILYQNEVLTLSLIVGGILIVVGNLLPPLSLICFGTKQQ